MKHAITWSCEDEVAMQLRAAWSRGRLNFQCLAIGLDLHSVNRPLNTAVLEYL